MPNPVISNSLSLRGVSPCSNIWGTCINTLYRLLCVSLSMCSSSSSSIAGLSFFSTPVNKNSSLQQHLSGLFVQPVHNTLGHLFRSPLLALVLSGFQTGQPCHLMWAGGVYSGVASSAAATQPLMLRPSAARCRSFVREPSVQALDMNRGPVDGARLWGPVVSPFHTQKRGYATEGVYLLERGGNDWEGATTLWPTFWQQEIWCMYLRVCVHVSPCIHAYMCFHPGWVPAPPVWMNTSVCVWTKAGHGSAEVELAKMGCLASHQGYSLRSHYEVGRIGCIFFRGVIVLKYSFPLF